MELLTIQDYIELFSNGQNFDQDSIEIIHDQVKILSEIFDNKNKEICPNCSENYKVISYSDKYKYELQNGKRKRVYPPPVREKVREAGCCNNCSKGSIGYFNFPNYYNEPKWIFDRLDKIKNRYNFNEKTGFFNLELKTCILPRELRSKTCLSHSCHALNLSQEEYHKVRKSVRMIYCLKKEMKLPV